MKKTSKILVGALTMALALPMMAIGANAATESGTTPVTYDTSYNIPDPDNPAIPEWAVVIPKVIVFTDDVNGREVDANVTLVAKNGVALPTGNDVIEVKLKSTNGFNLKYGAENLPYSVTYSADTIIGSLSTTTGVVETTIGKLQNGNVTITSKAKLAGNATVSGSHEDTLTYTVGKTVK